MRAKGFTPTGRNAGGRFVRKPGGRGHGATGGTAREMPPRGRADMTCVNCNRKGHSASECRQPRVERKNKKCFICNRPRHEAKACPNKPASAPRPIKAIEDAGARCTPSVFRVTEKPKSQQAQLGDFIRTLTLERAPTNRVQPLTLGMWQDIAAVAKSTTAINSVIVDLTLTSADCPPCCSGTFAKSVLPAP